MNTPNEIKIDVRIASLEDAESLVPMISFINGRDMNTLQIIERICATQSLETPFIAEANGETVGFASLRLVPALSSDFPHAEITDLFVKDDSQRIPIGMAFTKKIEEIARMKGAKHVYLMTGLRNIPVKNMYRALGYRDYALAMRKSINQSLQTTNRNVSL
jgi:ribosomal protein S18 acetylase RimI-like enzyme